MAVEVIRAGHLPEPQPVRGTCARCGCVVAALRENCDSLGNVACPTAGCGGLIRIDGAGVRPGESPVERLRRIQREARDQLRATFTDDDPTITRADVEAAVGALVTPAYCYHALPSDDGRGGCGRCGLPVRSNDGRLDPPFDYGSFFAAAESR